MSRFIPTYAGFVLALTCAVLVGCSTTEEPAGKDSDESGARHHTERPSPEPAVTQPPIVEYEDGGTAEVV